MINPKLNCLQISVLRRASQVSGYLYCDACTGKALVARGYAKRYGREFFITDAGRTRARKAADINESTGHSGNRESFYAEMLRDQE